MGESKQVDGNMRAVIMNENDVRVKDITREISPGKPPKSPRRGLTRADFTLV